MLIKISRGKPESETTRVIFQSFRPLFQCAVTLGESTHEDTPKKAERRREKKNSKENKDKNKELQKRIEEKIK